MVQFPIVAGIYADTAPDFRTAYPVNYIPVPKATGISEGYLRPADGLVELAASSGIDRGGINWNGDCYRVLGNNLCLVASDGREITIGNVGDDGQYVTLDYSFDDLAINSAGDLWLYNPTDGLRQNVDPDLGLVVDMIWIDGYFMTTDGASLIVTELNDPLAVNPLKYGSSEADPDPVIALQWLRNEAVAINRYTIEFFDNIGGSLFPFQRIEGAQIEKGAVGTHACCLFMEQVAFLGGGFNEQPSIYLGANANALPIATQEIDTILEGYTEAELSAVKLEARNNKAHWLLYVHLPDRTLVYDGAASQAMQMPIWFILTGGLSGFSRYPAQNFTWCYDRWMFGDPLSARLGYVDTAISTHYGDPVQWEFSTAIVYNEGRGAIFNELELVALTGSVAFGEDPWISTQYSIDGVNWSAEKSIQVGGWGERGKRLCWFRQGAMRNWRIQRFKGTSDAHIAVARLEAPNLEPLAW